MLGKNVFQSTERGQGENNSCIIQISPRVDYDSMLQRQPEGIMPPGNAGYLP